MPLRAPPGIFCRVVGLGLLFAASAVQAGSLIIAPAPPALGDAYCATVLVNEHPLSLRFERAAVDTILAKRMVADGEPVSFNVDGHVYKKVSVLGTSSTRAYLAVDEKGDFVVVKKDWPRGSHEGTVETYEDEDWLMRYDGLIAEYYASRGVEVPRIRALDFAHRLEVKDYEEGLTVDDIESSKYRDEPLLKNYPEESKALEGALETEMARIKEIHAGFKDWLKAHNPPVTPEFKRQAQRVIENGDIRRPNFLFSLKRQKWILFDP